MDRDRPRDGRRRPDTRDHKPRYDRDRSRSPPQRERRDDRRRDRSPYRGPARRGGAPRGGARDREPYRGRDRDRDGPPPPRGPAGRGGFGPGRPPFNDRPNGTGPRGIKKEQSLAPEVKMELLDGEDEEAMLARIMGFKGFRSTKNTKVPGNDKNYGVNKVKKAEYRQYMNRVGGFNRPLSPSRM